MVLAPSICAWSSHALGLGDPMRKIAIATLISLATLAGVPAYGALVQGTTSGTFSNATTGTISPSNQWNFASGANASSLLFTGDPFGLANTPLTFSLGDLLLTNGGNGGLTPGSYTSDLTISINFSTPNGQTSSFLDSLTLVIDNGSPGKKVAISSMPGPQSFTVGSTTYTVTFDGMFDSATGGTNITTTGLTVFNPGSGSAAANTGTAYLRATVSAQESSTPPPGSTIPEPGSLSLLLSAMSGLGIALYRKRAV